MKTHHAVARLPLGNASANSDDGSGDFVPENLRGRDKSVLNFFQIRAANSARGHSNQYFSRSDGRHRNGFHNHFSLPAVHRRAHRGRHRMRRS
jgi:hypothetical protein